VARKNNPLSSGGGNAAGNIPGSRYVLEYYRTNIHLCLNGYTGVYQLWPVRGIFFTRYLKPRGIMGYLKDIKMTNLDEPINYAKNFSGLTPELEARSKAIAPEMAPHLEAVKNSLDALYESCQRLN